mmetsp:Transcript_45693/g.89975  ORF Transcript_45693/g.89975 Transcript_45693/m.89975 type:complete len:207 (+) Transcript_45693:104-724(+)
MSKLTVVPTQSRSGFSMVGTWGAARTTFMFLQVALSTGLIGKSQKKWLTQPPRLLLRPAKSQKPQPSPLEPGQVLSPLQNPREEVLVHQKWVERKTTQRPKRKLKQRPKLRLSKSRRKKKRPNKKQRRKPRRKLKKKLWRQRKLKKRLRRRRRRRLRRRDRKKKKQPERQQKKQGSRERPRLNMRCTPRRWTSKKVASKRQSWTTS